jgi:8-oxo-dGTP pyrophosphatase MutT (NUDIX family)
MPTMPHSFEARLSAALEARPPQRVTMEQTRDAAVLVPFVGGVEPSLVFTVRTDRLPSHKGQISFPGGSVDAGDASPAAAALRETHEEIGMDPAVVRIVGELDSVPTFVTRYVILPFVGWIDALPELRPNPAEVAEILIVPASELTEEIRAAPGFSHKGRTYPTEAWIWNGHVIWGATARIVRVLLHRLAEAGLAPDPGDSPDWGWADPPGRLPPGAPEWLTG